jgi:hypothetical protein
MGVAGGMQKADNQRCGRRFGFKIGFGRLVKIRIFALQF